MFNSVLCVNLLFLVVKSQCHVNYWILHSWIFSEYMLQALYAGLENSQLVRDCLRTGHYCRDYILCIGLSKEQ